MGIPSLALAQIVAQMTAASSIWTDKKRPKSRAFVYTHTTGYGLGGFDSPRLHQISFRKTCLGSLRAAIFCVLEVCWQCRKATWKFQVALICSGLKQECYCVSSLGCIVCGLSLYSTLIFPLFDKVLLWLTRFRYGKLINVVWRMWLITEIFGNTGQFDECGNSRAICCCFANNNPRWCLGYQCRRCGLGFGRSRRRYSSW